MSDVVITAPGAAVVAGVTREVDVQHRGSAVSRIMSSNEAESIQFPVQRTHWGTGALSDAEPGGLLERLSAQCAVAAAAGRATVA
ncbi:hypothetical protein MT355_11085 [Rathayibacter sp. VKM Ac-2929]|uniref:hypothetical protein n=1 Tax=Rathayibacter sp. VKM Ac-2929 TaxID=2929480 RepID=UPI001FB3ACD9|nr:hypothetical protein [Rathayibacter sp. VKM Ac-2929]MCJ1673797.1 hypothetical protein [Rathayibacter sp. VKM Ac-2929]